jgi:hypothetical protein
MGKQDHLHIDLIFIGGQGWNRTADTGIFRQLLLNQPIDFIAKAPSPLHLRMA